jgi:putative membrane protein
MGYYIYKIIHVVGFVSWFAGLFYLGRMFVYHREALQKEEPSKSILCTQISLMSKRVYNIILLPALIITWTFGLLMIFDMGSTFFKANIWLHYKIFFLLLLTFYHWYCGKVMKGLQAEKMILSSTGFRLFNEVPTVLLILISSFAVLKNETNPLILFVIILGIIALLILLTLIYKKLRKD